MQKIILSLIFVAIATFAFGQSQDNTQIRKGVEEATALYNLTPEQVVKMEKIQTRHLKNLGEVASLKQTDVGQYVQKMESIRTGTENSIRMMLTKEQQEILHQKLIDRRIAVSDLIKEMQANGASKMDIRLAIIEKID